jgi:hypothetical protein
MLTQSMRQPSPDMLLSLPIRQRSMKVEHVGRLTVVVINPPEFPVDPCRPARGLPQQVLTVPL